MRVHTAPVLIIAFFTPLATAGRTSTEVKQPSWIEFATTVLDEAQARIKEHRNPRYAIERLSWTVQKLGPEPGLARLRRLSVLLREIEGQLPTENRAADDEYVNAHAQLAFLVQDRDPPFREQLLRGAVVDADRALAEPKLWIPPPGPRVWDNAKAKL